MTDFASNAEIIRFAKSKDAIFETMLTLHNSIFDDLPVHGAGSVQGKIVTMGTDISHVDLVCEVVNLIAAAAAIESKDYSFLVDLVRGLSNDKTDGTLWSTIPFRVAECCLQRHTGDTRFFLLLLIQAELITVYPVYKLLRKQGFHSPEVAALFVYFAPELKDLKGDWFEKTTAATSSDSVVNCLRAYVKGFSGTDTLEIFLAKRNTGEHGSPVLAAIRNDDFEAVVAALNGRSASAEKIQFSLTDGYFHFKVTWQKDVGYAAAQLMNAIGLFQADSCFTCMLQDTDNNDAAASLVSPCVGSLVSSVKFLSQLSDLQVDFTGALAHCARFHNSGAIEYLVSQKGLKIDALDINTAIKYANWQALIDLQKMGADISKTIVVAASANAVVAFRWLLFMGIGSFDPYAAYGPGGRTLLHFAGFYSAWDIFRVWRECWGELGMDALDEERWNPAHYAYVRGIHQQVASSDLPLRERFPDYHLLATE